MKKPIVLFSMLFLFFLMSSCDKEEINDETGIEDLQRQPQRLIDKEEVEPGPKG